MNDIYFILLLISLSRSISDVPTSLYINTLKKNDDFINNELSSDIILTKKNRGMNVRRIKRCKYIKY